MKSEPVDLATLCANGLYSRKGRITRLADWPAHFVSSIQDSSRQLAWVYAASALKSIEQVRSVYAFRVIKAVILLVLG